MEVRFESTTGNLVWHLPKDFSDILNNAPADVRNSLLNMNKDAIERLCSCLLGLQRSVPFIGPKKATELFSELIESMETVARKGLNELENNKNKLDNPPS